MLDSGLPGASSLKNYIMFIGSEVDTTIHCLVIALLLLTRYVTLWPWPFDLGQWSYMAGHVVNPSTKFEDPTAIRSWVMSSDISYRIPFTVHLQPLRMCRIT